MRVQHPGSGQDAADLAGLAPLRAQELPVGLPVQLVGARVDEGIDHRGGPGEDRGEHVEQRALELVVDDVGQHERQEAQEEAEEYREHELGHTGVLALLEARALALAHVGLEVLPAGTDLPVDAEVGDDDDETGQEEADDEEELLRAAAVLLEDRAGEGGLVEAEGAPDAEEWGDEEGEAQGPDGDEHQGDAAVRVDARVDLGLGDQDVPGDTEGGD